MTPEEEILEKIHEMDYVTISPRKISSSYYKLADGTILKVFINIDYLVLDPRQPGGYAVSSTVMTSAFVPREKRRPEAYTAYTASDINAGIIEEDVDNEVLQEDFSTYELSNGFILSIKAVLGQVRKTKFVTQQGEPIYSVDVNPIIKFKKK
jgi:hypothetical protein